MHMQKPFPETATGVKVTVKAVDSNGNAHTVGTATSDIGGSYGLAWTPPIEGTYKITAVFDGSESYGNSYATTYLLVGPPQASPAPSDITCCYSDSSHYSSAYPDSYVLSIGISHSCPAAKRKY